MKNYYLIVSAIAAILLVSCQKNEGVKTITVSANIDNTALEEEGVAVPESYEVTFTNFSTGKAITVESENNIAVAENIVPGVYKVSAMATSVSGGFTFYITANADNVNFLDEGDNVVIKASAVKESALIFKEIYYSGAPGDSYYFRDQFYEIYNNGNETVYADGLCIAETIFADHTFTTIYSWDIENQDQYVFAQRIWQIPGDGTTYPVKPGESFVIAQWGTNHKAANLSNGASPVDLTGAEFEAFCGESTTWNGITLTDEKAINMTLAVNTTGYSVPQWLTSVGGSRYVLFKPETALRTDNFIAATNAESETLAHEIKISEVVDAVEAIDNEARLQTLGLPTALDAGAIWCSGSYVGESIIRKVKEVTSDGRTIYQDTNNTTNDFEVKTDPQVRRNGEGVPSWNTWYK